MINSVAAGAFVDGPEFVDNSVPSNGLATYSGVAGGILAQGKPTGGGVDVREVLGTVELNVDFSDAIISGAIRGLGSGVEEITLDLANIDRSNGRIAPGTGPGHSLPVDVTVNGQTYTDVGKWGGRFSNVDDNGQPRRVAGTVGAEWTEGNGNTGAFVGAFIANKD